MARVGGTSMFSLAQLCPNGWHVEQEQPIAIGAQSALEPDLAVVVGGVGDPLVPRYAADVQDIAALET